MVNFRIAVLYSVLTKSKTRQRKLGKKKKVLEMICYDTP